MSRTFIFEELKRTFLPGVATWIAAVLVSLASKPLILRAVDNPGLADTFIRVIGAGMLATVASFSGAVAFSSTFRDGPLRLLEHLPISRMRIWFIRWLVCLATFVTVAALILVAFPSLLTVDPSILLGGAAIGIMLFACGNAFGMMVEANAAAAVGVNLLFSSAIALTLLLVTVVTASRTAAGRDFFVYAAFVYVPLFLLSIVVFQIGEFNVKRRSYVTNIIANVFIFGSLLAVVLLADSGALASGEAWQYARDWAASSDRRYLALIAQRNYHYRVTKALIVDVESGKVVSTFHQHGLTSLFWTREGSLYAISDGTVTERILGTGNGTARLTRIYPQLQEILNIPRSTISNGVESSRWGTFVTVESTRAWQRWKGELSTIRIDATGAPQEVLNAPRDLGEATILYSLPDGLRMVTITSRGVRRAWFIGPDVRPISSKWGPFSFSNEAGEAAFKDSIRKTAPRRADSKIAGVFLYSEDDYLMDKTSWIYFLETDPERRTARLLARRKEDVEWKEAIPQFTIGKSAEITRIPEGEYAPASRFGLWLGPRSGIVLHIDGSPAEPKIILRNLTTGERFDLKDNNSYEPSQGRSVGAYIGDDGLDIAPLRYARGGFQRMPNGYGYRPGQGAPVPKTVNASSLRAEVFKSPSGIEVRKLKDTFVARLPDGTTRQLWPNNEP